MDALKGRRILVLDEDPAIAMLLAEMVRSFGAEVVGPAKDIPEALALIAEERIDAAILDVKIGGKATYAIAKELTRRGTPFAFASGNKTPRSVKRFAPAAVVTKPYSAPHILRVLSELIERSG